MQEITPRAAQRIRKAAGNPRSVGAPVALLDAKRVLVTLDAPTRIIASEAGGGNVSAGIRLMAEYFQKNHG